jgi:hypothetical protein
MYFELFVGAWGMSVCDFWEMTPSEWWLIYEVKRPRDTQTDFAGMLSDNDVEELYELLG